MADEIIDVKVKIEAECSKGAQGVWKEYEACKDRITKSGHGKH